MSIRYVTKIRSVMLLLLVSTTLMASTGLHTSPAKHYISIALGGGEANNMASSTIVQHKVGAAGNLGFGYEMQLHRFLFGLGVEANYQLLRDGMNAYTETYSRHDFEGEAVQYGYYHQHYLQANHAINIAIPVYVGYQAERFYFRVGGNIQLPAFNQYKVTTEMLTEGTYAWSIEPVRTQGVNDFTQYGYYANADYTYTARFSAPLSAHAMVEIGSYLPLNDEIEKMRLRIGAYCSYGFRFGSFANQPVLDISRVDIDPMTQNQPNMQSNIVWNHLNTTNLYAGTPNNLEIGVRVTLLLNVNVSPHICNCLNE